MICFFKQQTLDDPEPFIDGVRINSPHYLCKIRLDALPQKYTLVISQYAKTTTIYYTLRAYSRTKFDLKKINNTFSHKKEVSGEWKDRTAGGCQNHETFKNNPLYVVRINQRDAKNFIIELRGPKVFQVGLEVSVHTLENSEITAPFVTKTTGNFRSGFCVLDMFDLPTGTYFVRPATYLPNQEAPFFITFKSTSNFTVEREK